MDNAEEVMQLLEEFSKMKPKDIPRELEEYLGYVAKTGDPVYQWALVKCLFREKLMSVITDFYESTPTIELPPCPNVDPFNYDRMKTGLLERLESFPSAPFTVQRICELLTNPRKEYNRVDKYMRAIEKNILVVSTREPGSGKRQDGDNNQSDAVLNGIRDLRGDVEDGVNSPLLGTPPASNEVIVSTCSEQEEIEISDSSAVMTESDKAWAKTSEDIIPTPTLQDSPLIFKTNAEETDSKDPSLQEDPTSSLVAVIEESSELAVETNNEALLENVDQITLKKEENPPQVVSSDEVEVSSTPEETTNESLSVITLTPEVESSEITSEIGLITEQITTDITSQALVSSSEGEESKDLVNISEIIINSSSTSKEVEQEESEKKDVIVQSPDESFQNDTLFEVSSNISIEKLGFQTVDALDSDPSDQLAQQIEVSTADDNTCQPLLKEDDREAEPIPEPLGLIEPSIISKIDETECSSSLEDKNSSFEIIPQVNLPPESTTSDETPEVPKTEASDNSLPEPVDIPEIVSSVDDLANDVLSSSVDTITKEKVNEDLIENTSEICDQERREGSIIHATPNLTTEIEPVLAMEEVSVDQSQCDVQEEEAMDVDESSNHQMVLSEGENEGEPMDQSDQPQS